MPERQQAPMPASRQRTQKAGKGREPYVSNSTSLRHTYIHTVAHERYLYVASLKSRKINRTARSGWHIRM